MLPAGPGRFFFGAGQLSWFEIARGDDGTPVMRWHSPETVEPERGVRIGDAPPPFVVAPAILSSYLGDYATEGPVMTVALGASGGLTIAPAGRDPMPLRAVSDTEFRIEGTPMRVVFERAAEGRPAERMTLHRGARELHGQRTSR